MISLYVIFYLLLFIFLYLLNIYFREYWRPNNHIISTYTTSLTLTHCIINNYENLVLYIQLYNISNYLCKCKINETQSRNIILYCIQRYNIQLIEL